MQKSKLKTTKSSLVDLGVVILLIHFLGIALYGATMTTALAAKYGVLSNTQLHLLLATISLPAVVMILLIERRLKRRLSRLVMLWIVGVWFIAIFFVICVLQLPNPKVSLEGRVRIKNAMQAGRMSFANDMLDAAMYQDIVLLQTFDELADTDNDYFRQRNRAIKLVKENWLKHSPEFLDLESNAFIEKICDRDRDCPKGVLLPKSRSIDLGYPSTKEPQI